MTQRTDFEERLERVAGERGATLWRSLDELADDPALEALARERYPSQLDRLATPAGRREFLKLMAASLALGGLSGCTRQPKEAIVPFASSPEARVPGRPQSFATTFCVGGAGVGLLVESHDGRPTKIEGNPDHPASLGATSAQHQATVLDLYDPDRSQVVRKAGRIRTWDELYVELRQAVEHATGAGGAGLAILSRTIASPTLARQRRELLARFPAAHWVQYEPINRDAARAGAELAFDRDLACRFRFDQAARVVSLGADFLDRGPASLRHARDFTRRRRERRSHDDATRLYVVETIPTNTGAAADERLALGPGELEGFAHALAVALGVRGLSDAGAHDPTDRWASELARDLAAHRGAAVVVCGEEQPPRVHALVHLMNLQLGAVGRTLELTDPVEPAPSAQQDELAELVGAMRSGAVETLIVLDSNPVYEAPGELDFASALDRVARRFHVGLYEDETAARCHWHGPSVHFLEGWSDALAFDGTASIVQPLIAPLYGGRTLHEIVALVLQSDERSAYDLVRATWRDRFGDEFEERWRRALHDGVIAGTRLEALSAVTTRWPDLGPTEPPDGGLQLVFAPDAYLWDGRFANNGWLQELPRPISMLCWDQTAWMAPATAERRGLASGDLVVLESAVAAVEVPIWVQPGLAEEVVVLHLGYGRERAGRLGEEIGVNACAPMSADGTVGRVPVALRKTAGRRELATTQKHHSMEGRDLVRSFDRFEAAAHGPPASHEAAATAAGDEAPPLAEHGTGHGSTSLYPEYDYDGAAWGMVIDLSACTGCRACVVACQSENNVPIVGREEVIRGREMHWIRVDRYYASAPDAAPGSVDAIHHQPVPCMHCENAPCEVVCPVGATVHGDEGLNEMVYNRCIGTRYCANNCPYKVRRFNFFKYADTETESLALGRNPDVTVRTRGVMEKCTYCVQRINHARIEAEVKDLPLGDGQVRTACQQACPSQAIAFGDLNDADSQIAQWQGSPLSYGLLEELGTRPRTTYLARIRNPHPDLEAHHVG